MDKLPTYRLTVTDDGDPALTFTALVDDPAIESNFMAFSKDGQPFQFKVQDEERRIITGAAMIPDKLIYRNDGNGEYNVYFTKEDIEKAVKIWAKYGKHNAVNIMHDQKKQPEGVYLIESFIVDKSRGITAPKVLDEDYPDGTWIQSYYVESDAMWSEVKAGRYKGFSVEGFFNMQFKRATNDVDEILSILNTFIKP